MELEPTRCSRRGGMEAVILSLISLMPPPDRDRFFISAFDFCGEFLSLVGTVRHNNSHMRTDYTATHKTLQWWKVNRLSTFTHVQYTFEVLVLHWTTFIPQLHVHNSL